MPKPTLNSRAAASPFRTQKGTPRIYISSSSGRVSRDGREITRKAFTLRGTDRLEVVEEAIVLWIKTHGLGGSLSVIHQIKKKPRKARSLPKPFDVPGVCTTTQAGTA